MDAATGEILPEQTLPQIEAIPDLPMDWSQIVTRDGQQIQTVGSHWPLSRSLNNQERTRMERTGVCMGCHQNMAAPAFWDDEVVAKYGRMLTDEQHIEHMNERLREAVAAGALRKEATPLTTLYVFIALAVGLLAGGVAAFLFQRRGKVDLSRKK